MWDSSVSVFYSIFSIEPVPLLILKLFPTPSFPLNWFFSSLNWLTSFIVASAPNVPPTDEKLGLMHCHFFFLLQCFHYLHFVPIYWSLFWEKNGSNSLLFLLHSSHRFCVPIDFEGLFYVIFPTCQCLYNKTSIIFCYVATVIYSCRKTIDITYSATSVVYLAARTPLILLVLYRFVFFIIFVYFNLSTVCFF